MSTRRRLRTNSARRSSMPWIWSACSWVISTPSSQSTSASRSCSRRSGEVSTRTRVRPFGPRRSTSSEVRRRRFFGLFGSQAPQPSAGRGTPMDEPQPRMVKRKRHAGRRWPARGTLLNRRKKLSVVCARDLLRRHAAGLGQHPGGLDHIGRLAALAAELAGREIGRVGLDQDAVGRQLLGDGAQLVGFLEGQDAGERHVEAKLDAGEGQLAAAGEAVQHRREGAPSRFPRAGCSPRRRRPRARGSPAAGRSRARRRYGRGTPAPARRAGELS